MLNKNGCTRVHFTRLTLVKRDHTRVIFEILVEQFDIDF